MPNGPVPWGTKMMPNDIWVQAMKEASRAVCGYCADPENWREAKRGTYPEYWHISNYDYNVKNPCSAWAIHHLVERKKASKMQIAQRYLTCLKDQLEAQDTNQTA